MISKIRPIQPRSLHDLLTLDLESPSLIAARRPDECARSRRSERLQSADGTPKVFFQVGAACSFSENAVTSVASRSTVTSPPIRGRSRVPSQRPGPIPGRGTRRSDRLQRISGQRADQPPDDRAGQLRLCPQHRAISARQSPPSARDRQVRDDLSNPGSVGAIDPSQTLTRPA